MVGLYFYVLIYAVQMATCTGGVLTMEKQVTQAIESHTKSIYTYTKGCKFSTRRDLIPGEKGAKINLHSRFLTSFMGAKIAVDT